MSKKRKAQLEKLREQQDELKNLTMCYRCDIEHNKYNVCPICGYTI